jgi:uncharacterized membrane protein
VAVAQSAHVSKQSIHNKAQETKRTIALKRTTALGVLLVASSFISSFSSFSLLLLLLLLSVIMSAPQKHNHGIRRSNAATNPDRPRTGIAA